MRRPDILPAALVVATIGLIAAGASQARGLTPTSQLQDEVRSSVVTRTPVVFFPGYATSRLKVVVRGQTSYPDCPRNGSFEDGLTGVPVLGPFTQVCRDKLLTLRYHADRRGPMQRRFTRPHGVRVTLINNGQPSNAPLYSGFFKALEAKGYRPGRDLRVAGYNFRLTPDMDGFLHRTRELVERTYRQNGKQPVRLVGHSNGPLYAQYLLNHVSDSWKSKYLQGFTAIAGNFPGSGSFYTYLFTGLNISTFSYPTSQRNSQSSARLYLSSPSTYLTAADPDYFRKREVVVEDSSTGRQYTPADYSRLFADATWDWAKPIAEYYFGFVRFSERRWFPGVDTTAEKGSGLPTRVGVVLPSMTAGQVLDTATTPFLDATGDRDQESITNDATGVWRGMDCHRFRLRDNPGVDHYELPTDPAVLRRLFADLERDPSDCGG